MAAEQGRQHLQRRRQNIRQHGLVLPLRPLGQTRVHLHAVGLRILSRGFHGCRVNVHRVDLCGAKFRGADRQDAGAAAIVEHAPQRLPGRVAMFGNPAQAHARGWVGSRAKGQPRIQADATARSRGHLVPRRHDPEIGRDVHRRELGLREPDPVLLLHHTHPLHDAALEEILGLQQLPRLLGRLLRRKQGSDAATLPTLTRGRHARFSKKRLLGIGVRVGIFHGHAQGFQRIERVAHGLHPFLGTQQVQLEHGISLLARDP